MKIGIGLPNEVRDVRARVIPAWAARAERAGFSSVGTVGRIAYPGVLDTVALAAAAGATSTVGLISTVMLGPVWPALLAKELAGIDGVSGGRLTIGIGIGNRSDDFVVDGLCPKGLGRRLEADLETYRAVWTGQPVGGGDNAAVPAGTREVPLLFGGFSPASFARMARWGQGWVGPAAPAAAVAGMFDTARAAWKQAGREGSPRLVAIAYFALGDIEAGRAALRHYSQFAGDVAADQVAASIHWTADALRDTVEGFAEIGADELILNPSTDDLDDIDRLAAIVL